MKLLVAGVCIGMASGLWFSTIINESTANRQAKFQDELRKVVQGVSSESAKVLDAKLQDIHSNEIRTERLVHTETIKPVFTNVCATDEYVRVFNESVERAERTLSGKPDGEMPGKPAAPGRENGK